jgi:hypothetical protein
MKGYDDIAQAEADHFMKCPGCGEWFDLRHLGQMLPHIHDPEIEIIDGEGQPPHGARFVRPRTRRRYSHSQTVRAEPPALATATHALPIDSGGLDPAAALSTKSRSYERSVMQPAR